MPERCPCYSQPEPSRRSRCKLCGRIAGPEPTHACHARRCEVDVPPSRLMCPRHWRMVPRALQVAVWAAYRDGQEIRKDPTPEYLRAAHAAIEAVDALERARPPAAQGELFAPRKGA